MNKTKTHSILVRGLTKRVKDAVKKEAKSKRLSANSFLLTVIEGSVIKKSENINSL